MYIITQKKLVINVYFLSQYGHWPLVCMNRSRMRTNYFNGLRENAPRLVYSDSSWIFFELLIKDKSLTIHQ